MVEGGHWSSQIEKEEGGVGYELPSGAADLILPVKLLKIKRDGGYDQNQPIRTLN